MARESEERKGNALRLQSGTKKKGGESKSESASDSSANDQQNSAEETPEPRNVSALLGEE